MNLGLRRVAATNLHPFQSKSWSLGEACSDIDRLSFGESQSWRRGALYSSWGMTRRKRGGLNLSIHSRMELDPEILEFLEFLKDS